MRALPNCWISERIAVTVLLSGIGVLVAMALPGITAGG